MIKNKIYIYEYELNYNKRIIGFKYKISIYVN